MGIPSLSSGIASRIRLPVSLLPAAWPCWKTSGWTNWSAVTRSVTAAGWKQHPRCGWWFQKVFDPFHTQRSSVMPRQLIALALSLTLSLISFPILAAQPPQVMLFGTFHFKAAGHERHSIFRSIRFAAGTVRSPTDLCPADRVNRQIVRSGVHEWQ